MSLRPAASAERPNKCLCIETTRATGPTRPRSQPPTSRRRSATPPTIASLRPTSPSSRSSWRHSTRPRQSGAREWQNNRPAPLAHTMPSSPIRWRALRGRTRSKRSRRTWRSDPSDRRCRPAQRIFGPLRLIRDEAAARPRDRGCPRAAVSEPDSCRWLPAAVSPLRRRRQECRSRTRSRPLAARQPAPAGAPLSSGRRRRCARVRRRVSRRWFEPRGDQRCRSRRRRR